MKKQIMILFATLIFFLSTSSIYAHGKTAKSYMKIHNKIYCLKDEDALEIDDEMYYKLDFAIDKLGRDFQVSGKEVTIKVRNVDITLNKNSKDIVIKTPPYGTRLNDDGVLVKTDFSHKDDLYMNQPDRREEF